MYIKHNWIEGECITAEKLNGLEGGIDCLANCSCLWENEQPESSFAAQDITLDAAKYKTFDLCFVTEEKKSFQNITVQINKDRAYKHNGAYRFCIKHDNFERYVEIYDDKIHFSDCTYAIKYNDKLIPYSIHAFV